MPVTDSTPPARSEHPTTTEETVNVGKQQRRAHSKLGQYMMGPLLGTGGFGSVYKALDTVSGVHVAVKSVGLTVLNSPDLTSIEMEISLLSKLKHKNIVKYIESIRTPQHFNIILELVEGGSLYGNIRKYGPFNEHLCSIYTKQILSGLDYLHYQDVIHRDIKGANVLSTKNGRVKLADFGVAMKLSEVDNSKRRVVGTPYWMAPEIIKMEVPTPACDIWSVGSTVIEMLTEKPPYADLYQMTALYRIVQDEHPPLPDGIPEELQNFLQSCFMKNPAHRPSASDLLMEEWILKHSRKPVDAKDGRPTQASAFRSKIVNGDDDSDDEEDPDEAEATAIIGGMNAMEASLQLRTPVSVPRGPASVPESVIVKELFNSQEQPTIEKTANETSPSMDEVQHQFRFMNLPSALEPSYSPRRLNASVTGRSLQTAVEDDDGEQETVSKRSYFSNRRRTSSFVSINSGDQTPRSPLQNLGQDSDWQNHGGPGSSSGMLAGGASSGNKDEVRNVPREIRQLLENIRPYHESEVLVQICKRLMTLLQQNEDTQTYNLVMNHGAVPIVEMLQVTDPTLLRTVLRFVNQIVESNSSFQEFFATVGLIPAVIKFARPNYSRALRYESALFVSRLCHTSPRSLKMLVACGGLEALVDLISHDYYHNRDLVYLGLDALNKVFEEAAKAESLSTRDFCRILAKHGLCAHLCLLVDTFAMDTLYEQASKYLQVVVNLLLLFAKEGDANVKIYMAKGTVLEGMISSLEFLPLDLVVQVCKTFKYLAKEPSTMSMLENAGVVPVLCQVFTEHRQFLLGPIDGADAEAAASADAAEQCLHALHSLCEYSRPRQEQAALAGVIPHLMDIGLYSKAQVRGKAFGLLCAMTRASLATRNQMWDEKGLGVAYLVHCMSNPDLQVNAFEALVDWLSVHEHKANWGARVEEKLLAPVPPEADNLEQPGFFTLLLALFKTQQQAVFMKVLEPLLKLLRVSVQINQALANSDEFLQELVSRLRNDTEGGAIDALESPGAVVQTLKQANTIAPTQSGAPRVRRFYSEPAPAGRMRGQLLKLLMLLCQDKTKEWLRDLCQHYQLKALVEQVREQEAERRRVILCDVASQLLGILTEALADSTAAEAVQESCN